MTPSLDIPTSSPGPRRVEWRRKIYRLLGNGAKAKDILVAISNGHHVLESEDRGAVSQSDERHSKLTECRLSSRPSEEASSAINSRCRVGTFRDLGSYLLGACRSAGLADYFVDGFTCGTNAAGLAAC